LNSRTNENDKARVKADYSLKDIDDYYVYFRAPSTSEKEKNRLINILNKHDTVTDSDIVQMYMDYGINRRNTSVLSFEQLYLEELPDFVNVSETIKTEIENSYRKTTLTDSTLTQADYDYIIDKYKDKYEVTLYYRQLIEEITPQQKQELQAIFNRYPEITRDIDDKYEKFDEDYSIPVFIASEKFRDIINILSLEDSDTLSDYYERIAISSDDDIYELDIPNDEQITVYVLRDDLTEKEKLRLETYDFAALGKHFAAFLNINNQVNYRDMKEISSWARESVETMSRLNLMTGANILSFTPFDFITQEEVDKIINNITSGVIIY
jgi:hypothetical protein